MTSEKVESFLYFFDFNLLKIVFILFMYMNKQWHAWVAYYAILTC